MHIEIGDLRIKKDRANLQVQLFNAIRDKIISGEWPKAHKLPSTRLLALELKVSRNTVIAAYNQLSQEGFIKAYKGSGYRVAVSKLDPFMQESGIDSSIQNTNHNQSAQDFNRAFSPGIPDLAQFPNQTWQRILNHHSGRKNLFGIQDLQGLSELREGICQHLKSARSVQATRDMIVITNGAQEALFIAMKLVTQLNDSVLIEDPGYRQARQAADLAGLSIEPMPITPTKGIELANLAESRAKLIYTTPSNQYPLGTSITTKQRLQLLEWAQLNQGWIIEDDYDSEFQFEHRPFTSIQGLSCKAKLENRVIYIGSFSKIMSNGIRLGYLVLPPALVEKAQKIKSAVSGQSNTLTQAAMAEFIGDGHLVRHIRKMRKLYHAKYQQLSHSIQNHFNGELQIVSQAAGLHITTIWEPEGFVTETQFVELASELEVTVRPLSYYFNHNSENKRDWHGVVFGFGNVSVNDIETLIAALASRVYSSLSNRK
jgi:GntR family transcriptional regulator/MocR family aminotransferase